VLTIEDQFEAESQYGETHRSPKGHRRPAPAIRSYDGHLGVLVGN